MRRPISVRPKPKTKKTTANYRPPSSSSVSRKKPNLRPSRSLGSRLMGGIRGIGSKIRSDIQEIRDNAGKPRDQQTQAYRDKTAATREKHNQAVDRMKKRRKKRRLRAEQEAAKQNPQTPTPTPTPPEAGIPSLRVTPEMRQAALEIFEAQQGAGQMPYYMAAARQGPNASPAFNYAAQNYATLGGAQRLAPRPMEMMSVAERQQINRMAEGMLPQPMPTPEQQYQQGMDMVMRGGKGGPRTGPQLPPGMVGLPRDPYQMGRPQQPPSQFSPFTNMLASRFGGFGGY